ncbi:MAG TPA: hypothetical protein VGI83_02465, partial [Gemmatimonadales bacterium]
APNPAGYVLDHKDSLQLALTPDQIASLTAERDSTIGRTGELADTITVTVQKQGASPDMTRILQQLAPTIAEFRRLQREILARVREILTPEQYARLPEQVRTPPGLGPAGGRRGGGPGGGQ